MTLYIGKRIQQRRIELGLSQDELADRLGYKNRSAVSRIEQGYNFFSIEKIEEFAKVLQISVPDLMGWDIETEEFVDIVAEQISEQDKALQEELLEYYRKLNTLGKKEANKRVEEMTEIRKYTEGE